MSLNGLDDATVKEAHELTVSEPGGWFLLKYASRDEIGLHARGNGGIVEIRNAIAQYEDASPLYGFLKYRRRNVIIKYLPENCSRLVQARVAVHFNAVCERFAPYNTTFSIADASGLKDTKLSAACSLHTASSSTSSSTSSLRRRRLMEIAEEEEEEQRAIKRQSVVKEEDRVGGTLHETGSGIAPSQQDSQPVTLNAQLANSPHASQFAGTAEPPSFTGIDRPSSSAKSLDPRRLSSQLTRPEIYSYASYNYGKPKVKLAPRPSLDASGRPRTSAGTGSYRPVSAIPAGFKLFSKDSRKGRDDNRNEGYQTELVDEQEKTDGSTLPNPEFSHIPVPANPPETSLDVKRPHTSGGRPLSSPGIPVKSVPTVSAPTTAKQAIISPEKARLIKAMKLREKNKKLSSQPHHPIPIVDVIEAPEASKPDLVNGPLNKTTSAGADCVAGSLDGCCNGPIGDLYASSGIPNSDAPSDAGRGDSAIDIGLSIVDRSSINSRTTDSHPASPLTASSEVGDSTKASSLSESTDETIQLLQDLKQVPDSDDNDRKVVSPNHCLTAVVCNDAMRSSEVVHQEHQETAQDVHITVGRDNAYVEQPSPRSEDAPGRNVAAKTDYDEVPGAMLLNDQPVVEPPQCYTEGANTNHPATSTTPELSPSDKGQGALPTSNVALTITTPEPRDSQSTIGLESNDALSSDAKRARRRALIDPIRTNLASASGTSTATNISDDDELMEELQSATVQEAKPMTVSKSPINSVFPSTSPSKLLLDTSDNNIGRSVRTVSNPVRGSLLVPEDVIASSARSVSSGAAFLHKIAQKNSASLVPKSSNIGSSISQRIRALEKLSGGSTAGTVPETSSRVERPTSTFFSVRRAGGRNSSKSPSVAERASSLTRDKTPSPPTSSDSTPELPWLLSRDRSGSMASRLSVFEGGHMPRGRPESVQVKARIIRDPMQPFPKMPDTDYDPSEPSQLNFKQSPLVVDHQKATPSAVPVPSPKTSALARTTASTEPMGRRESIQERRMSKERRSQSQDRPMTSDDADSSIQPRRRSSLSIVRDFIKERRGSVMNAMSPSTDSLTINNLMSPSSLPVPSKSPSRPPSVHATHGLVRRLSISSRRSTSKDRDTNTPPLSGPLSPSLMTEASGSGDESKSTTSEAGHKKSGSGSKNRASRFMRRLSSSLSTSRKATTPAISPTVAEEEEILGAISASKSSSTQQNIVSYIGDVNVQFPDNLLWKRRTMCLDSQGFLILSTGNGVSVATTAISISSNDRPAGIVKRYHLTDFRPPYIPEMEVQELPNSVCLDFIDGSGLQVACEDRPGQLAILQVLLEAHQTHTSFGQ